MELVLKQIEELKRLLEESKLQNKEFLTLEESARYLSVSKSHLYKLTSKNEIPFYQPTGKKIYFKKAEIDKWIFNSKVQSVSDVEDGVELYLGKNKRASL